MKSMPILPGQRKVFPRGKVATLSGGRMRGGTHQIKEQSLASLSEGGDTPFGVTNVVPPVISGSPNIVDSL